VIGIVFSEKMKNKIILIAAEEQASDGKDNDRTSTSDSFNRYDTLEKTPGANRTT